MDHILILTRTALSHPFATFLRTLQETRRIGTDAARRDALPRERLEDMGIAPRTEDNRRHSGQPGRMPQTLLW